MYILFIVLTFAGQMDLIRQKRKEQTRERLSSRYP